MNTLGFLRCVILTNRRVCARITTPGHIMKEMCVNGFVNDRSVFKESG